MNDYFLKGKINIEIIEIVKLLLNFFSQTTGLVIALYTADGKELWSESERHSPLCKYLKSNPKLWELCQQNHFARSSIDSFNGPDKKKLKMCHFGLWNYSYPIYHENYYYGALSIGEVKLSDRESMEQTNNQFEKKLFDIRNKGYLNAENEKVIRKYFNEVSIIDKFPEDLLKTLENTKENLIRVIQDLLRRVKKITLLRHELHQPNIAVQGILSDALDVLMDIREKQSRNKEIICGIDSAINNIGYAINNSKLFMVTIENICSSLSKDHLALNLKSYNIIKLLNDAIRLFKKQADEKDVDFSPISTEHLETINVLMDRSLIMRAFINIYHNAVKYSYSGRKRSEQKRPRVIVTECHNLKRYFRITVSNYGIGILRNEIDKVWEEGYRGKLSIDEHRTGSGLGLSQIKEIVIAHKGRVNIKSRPLGDNIITGPYLTAITVDLPYCQDLED